MAYFSVRYIKFIIIRMGEKTALSQLWASCACSGTSDVYAEAITFASSHNLETHWNIRGVLGTNEKEKEKGGTIFIWLHKPHFT